MKRLSKRGQQNMRSNYHDPNDRPLDYLPDNYRNVPECVPCRTTRDTLDEHNQSHGFGPWRLGAPGTCGPCCGGPYAAPGPRQCYPGIQGGVPIDRQANKIANMKRNNRRAPQGVGKITTLPRLGIQVQGTNARPGQGPCNTMCISRRYENNQPGPWSEPWPAASPPHCGDCCSSAGGGPRLSPNEQQVCRKGSNNVAVAMANRAAGKSAGVNKQDVCAPGSTDKKCGFMCNCEDGIRAGMTMWCGYYPGRTCVECCNGEIYPRGRYGMGDSPMGNSSTVDYEIGNSAIDRNFSGGGNQNAIWSGAQSNVGPQDRIFAGNYASGIFGSECNPPCDYSKGERCEDGICLPGDPARKRKPPLYSYQEDDPNLRQVGGGCAPLCGTPPNCRPCGSTGPTYPGGKKKRQCNSTADCPPKHLCRQGDGVCVEFFLPGEYCPNGKVANGQGFMEDVCVLPSSSNNVRRDKALRRRRR